MLTYHVILLAVAVSMAAAVVTDMTITRPGLSTCFTCDNAATNDECVGTNLDHSTSPHGNGTLHACLEENPTCYMRWHMNGDSSGYRIAKGCMDLKECLLEFAWQWDDWDRSTCFIGNPTADEFGVPMVLPPTPNTDCLFCCAQWQTGYANQLIDGCNYGLPLRPPFPVPNVWNDTDEWPGHSHSVHVEPEGYVPDNWFDQFDENAATSQRPLSGATQFALAILVGVVSSWAL